AAVPSVRNRSASTPSGAGPATRCNPNRSSRCRLAMRDLVDRRQFLACAAGAVVAADGPAAATPVPKKVAAAVPVFTRNSHAEMIVGRLLEGYTLDGKGPRPGLKLVSLYVDQAP